MPGGHGSPMSPFCVASTYRHVGQPGTRAKEAEAPGLRGPASHADQPQLSSRGSEGRRRQDLGLCRPRSAQASTWFGVLHVIWQSPVG